LLISPVSFFRMQKCSLQLPLRVQECRPNSSGCRNDIAGGGGGGSGEYSLIYLRSRNFFLQSVKSKLFNMVYKTSLGLIHTYFSLTTPYFPLFSPILSNCILYAHVDPSAWYTIPSFPTTVLLYFLETLKCKSEMIFSRSHYLLNI
jgi:hypothetical protein